MAEEYVKTIFGTVTYGIDAPEIGLIRPTKVSAGFSLNTNYAKAQVRLARKLGKTTVAIEGGIDKDTSGQ